MPEILKHCVGQVGKEKGKSRAFAICTASLQKAGILKKGTQELTAKGKKAEDKHKKEMDRNKKLADYEKVIDRKSPKPEYESQSASDKLQDFIDEPISDDELTEGKISVDKYPKLKAEFGDDVREFQKFVKDIEKAVGIAKAEIEKAARKWFEDRQLRAMEDDIMKLAKFLWSRTKMKY